jgi:hypothetical protein
VQHDARCKFLSHSQNGICHNEREDGTPST